MIIAVVLSKYLQKRFEITPAHSTKVAQSALLFSQLADYVQPVLVNGAVGIISWLPDGRPFSVMGFTVRNGRIIEINVLRDPLRLSQLDLTVVKD